jgi:hypothetical protein
MTGPVHNVRAAGVAASSNGTRRHGRLGAEPGGLIAVSLQFPSQPQRL